MDFLFNLRDYVLLVIIVSLDATILLATILVSLCFGVLLVTAVNLVSFLAYLSLKVFNFMKYPFDRPKIINHVFLRIVQKVKPSIPHTI